MKPRVLHVLSQRPGRTGSGVTLEAMVTRAEAAGWQQAVAVGVPATEPTPTVGGLPTASTHALTFATAEPAPAAPRLDFPVPGMSDVMPYPSTVWSAMDSHQLDQYRATWRAHLTRLIQTFRPDVIHSHHVWLVSSLLKEIAPAVPLVITCHSTGLRQMVRLPALAREVARGCAQADHFCVLRSDHAALLADRLGVAPSRITVVGAGYDPVIFRGDRNTRRAPDTLLFVGKFSPAKGLPWLLDACEELARRRPNLHLHVAGDGSGPPAEALRSRMATMTSTVTMHGQLSQTQLADLMGRCQVCVLPSFYEGVPLVLVEAAACGCRLVATALPGVRDQILPHLGPWLSVVDLPRLRGSDTPVADDLPSFVSALTAGLGRALDGAGTPHAASLAPFDWATVFDRVDGIWRGLKDYHA